MQGLQKKKIYRILSRLIADDEQGVFVQYSFYYNILQLNFIVLNKKHATQRCKHKMFVFVNNNNDERMEMEMIFAFKMKYA